MVETHEREPGPPLPPGVVDRWLLVEEAALLARRQRGQIHMALSRGRLTGRKVRRRWRGGMYGGWITGWEIRLSELNRYVQRLGTGTRGGPRPRKPTELDWEALATLPNSSD